MHAARCALPPIRDFAVPRVVGLSGASRIVTYLGPVFQCTPTAYQVTKVTPPSVNNLVVGVIVLSVARKFQQHSYEILLLLIFAYVS